MKRVEGPKGPWEKVMKSANTLLALAAALALGTPLGAVAATETGHFNVTIKIASSCQVDTGSGQTGAITSDSYTASGADLDFGSHASTETDDVDAVGNAGATGGIQVICTNGQEYDIGLLPSNSNTSGVGSMAALGLNGANTDTVAYSMFQDAGRATAWGNVIGTNTLHATGTGAAQQYPVYGRVFGTELNKKADRYADRVTVTVTY